MQQFYVFLMVITGHKKRDLLVYLTKSDPHNADLLFQKSEKKTKLAETACCQDEYHPSV